MSCEDNTVEIRAASRERITFTLKEDDVAIDLTDYTKAVLYLKDNDSGSITEYATDDSTPILSFDNNRTTGKIHLNPDTNTFTNDHSSFSCYIDITHSNGKIFSFCEDEEYIIKVRNNFRS